MRTRLLAPTSAGLFFFSIVPGYGASLSTLDVGPVDLFSGTYSRTLLSENFVRQVNDGVLTGGSQNSGVASGETTLSYRADIASGEVGVAAQSSGSADVENGSVQSKVFDTVSFGFATGTSGLITYQMTVEATISQATTDNGYIDQTVFAADVRVSDVTGLGAAFFLGGADGQPQLMSFSANSASVVDIPGSGTTPDRVYADPETVSWERGFASVTESTSGNCGFLEGYSYCFEDLGNATGEEIPLAFTLIGSFIAEEGKTYALELSNSASVNGTDGMLDAMSTSIFSFTDTSGATVFSASGLLPGTVGVGDTPVVPLPAPALMLLGGLATFVGIRRRRRV